MFRFPDKLKGGGGAQHTHETGGGKTRTGLKLA